MNVHCSNCIYPHLSAKLFERRKCAFSYNILLVAVVQNTARYKIAVKEPAWNADKAFSDELLKQLGDKNHVEFWKSWHRRFCSNDFRPSSCINGCHGDKDMLQEFTILYMVVFTCLFTYVSFSMDCCGNALFKWLVCWCHHPIIKESTRSPFDSDILLQAYHVGSV